MSTFCGCSLVVELQPSKLTMWVRFPSSAPLSFKLALFSIGGEFFSYIKVHDIFDIMGFFRCLEVNLVENDHRKFRISL